MSKVKKIDATPGVHHLIFHIYPYAFAMAAKLRSIHALNAGDAIAKITGMGYMHWIFKNKIAFG